ncbi:MAG: response regulator [Candidatus Fermentibacteraceae bacterium]|nr:response regulator [Candidatus Fermentibacteraceae bacterium]
MPAILIVDDDTMVRTMLVNVFQRDNYSTFEAADGQSALRIYKDEAIDIVITDIVMPEMEGIETIRELRRINPDAKIIAFSGGGSLSPDGYLKIAASMGANYTFAKPFEINELKEAVKKLLVP